MGEMRNAHKILIGKPEGTRPYRKWRHRWEDNVRMNLRETGWEGGAGCIWLSKGTSGNLLWTWYWTFKSI